MKVKSKVKPPEMIIDDYRVYINSNIQEVIEKTGDSEITMYEYNQQRYEKNEYIASLHTQVTNAQLALVELYEIQLQLGGGE